MTILVLSLGHVDVLLKDIIAQSERLWIYIVVSLNWGKVSGTVHRPLRDRIWWGGNAVLRIAHILLVGEVCPDVAAIGLLGTAYVTWFASPSEIGFWIIRGVCRTRGVGRSRTDCDISD